MKRSAVGSLLRTTQAYCIQVCEKQTLEYGIAYSCERFPDLAEVQQFREVIAKEPQTLEKALHEAEGHFASLQRRFQVIALAEDTPSDSSTEFFASHGFHPKRYRAMALTEWIDLPTVDTVRILPARPMRAALKATFDDDARADLCDLRLDDPQYDMFVATVDGKPAGRCALYQVGDIARVMDFHLNATANRDEVERALLKQVLAMARRLEMRNICTLIEEGRDDAVQLMTDAGFTHDGDIVEFHRSDPDQVNEHS